MAILHESDMGQIIGSVRRAAVYGELLAVDNETGEAVVDATPRIISGWNTNGDAVDMTVSLSENTVTALIAGIYHVNASLSFNGSNAKTYQLTLYKFDASANAWIAQDAKLDRKLSASGDVGSASIAFILPLDVGDKIAVYQSTSDGGSAMTLVDAQLVVYMIGIAP